MSQEYTDEQILQMKMKAALEESENLPYDTFAAVPDEDIVTLEVSGQFGRVLNRVLEYLYQSESEEEVIKSANLVAKNFEGVQQDDISLHSLALWSVSNLLANFSMQAGLQNKTKIYDRDKIMTHIFGGITSDEALKPLTPEELEERRARDKNKPKNTKPREEGIVNLDDVDAEKARDARRKRRYEQRLKQANMSKMRPTTLTDEEIQARLNKDKEELPDTNPED